MNDVALVHPDILFYNVRLEFWSNLHTAEDTVLFAMKNDFCPSPMIHWILQGGDRHAECCTNMRRNEIRPAITFQHFLQTVAATTRRNLHDVGFSIRCEACLNIIDACPHIQKMHQAIEFAP